MADAFAAALEIDNIMENNTILTSLVDIDDGTDDGNTRYDRLLLTPYYEDSGDAFGPVGDGRVDMRDFRRFRDALLAIEGDQSTRLNGDEDHPKRDLNFDGRVELASLENVFPRYDFNGDGRVSRGDEVPVGGTVKDSVTDLQVLMQMFADPDVATIDLPNLLDSGDVHIGAADSIGLGEIASVEFIFVGQGARPTVLVYVDENMPRRIVTLPEGTYDTEMRYLDASGTELARRSYQIEDLLPGEDMTLEAPSLQPLALRLMPETITLMAGQQMQFRAAVDQVFREGEEIFWSATGGSISDDGTYTAGSTVGTYTVTATSRFDDRVFGQATVTIAENIITGTYIGTRVEWDYGDCYSCTSDPIRLIVEEDGMNGYIISYCTMGSGTSFCTQFDPWQRQYMVQLAGNSFSGIGRNYSGIFTDLTYTSRSRHTTKHT